jgi:hypothetical protein
MRRPSSFIRRLGVLFPIRGFPVVPSPQVVPITAAQSANDTHAVAQRLVEQWRRLNPIEQEIIVILVTSWAAHDARAGIGLAQPLVKRSA